MRAPSGEYVATLNDTGHVITYPCKDYSWFTLIGGEVVVVGVCVNDTIYLVNASYDEKFSMDMKRLSKYRFMYWNSKDKICNENYYVKFHIS